jgi:hypothetical protein
MTQTYGSPTRSWTMDISFAMHPCALKKTLLNQNFPICALFHTRIVILFSLLKYNLFLKVFRLLFRHKMESNSFQFVSLHVTYFILPKLLHSKWFFFLSISIIIK